MNRPSARNALGNVFISQLLEALAQLREDRQVHVLIFRRRVKGVFCAGADLKEREQMSEAEVGVFVQRLRGLMTEIAAFPAPTIAAMDGFALGGGLELALACDLRVAASSAVMGLIETARGLLPGAGGTQRLPRCLGVALAKELIFTGQRLSGAQAQALGLVNHAVAQNEEGNAAYHRARELAQEILPQAPTAVRLSKVAIDRGIEAQEAAQGSRPIGGAVCKGLVQSSELSAGGGGGGPSGPFPEWAPMLRALTSTLRFPRPWRPLETRGCSSNPGAAGREIQVCALAGPDRGIAEILMNRPSARNALGNVFVSQLLEALAQLREDQQVRVLIFRSGVKGVFCAGADLKEREQMSEAEVGVFVQRLRGLMTEIAAFPAPTIAAMDGFALGGGLELALACDLRVAASSAVMGLIETTRGLLPGAGGTQRLPRCLGVALAKELIFTGRRLSGAQAQALGLVNHAVAQNEEGNAAYHRARELAQEILPQAPIAVRLSKVAIDRGIEVDIASGMAIEGICYAQNIPTRDRLEGMAAFREKRLPRFVGE